MPNLVSITRPSLQILGKTQTWVFLISGFLVSPLQKKIVIIPEPVMILTWIDKRNKTTSKKIDVDLMSENYDVIVIFRIFGQFGAIRRPDSGHRVCKSYVFSNRNLLSYKNWKQNLKISNTALTLLLWVKVLFWTKNANFLQKNADISKIKGA